MAELQGRFQQVTGSSWIGVLETANVAYFIVAAQAHEQALRAACGSVARQWHPHIRMLQE
jgi:hypothetical protein